MIKVIKDVKGQSVVVMPEIIFKNRKKIDWEAVERYLQIYVGEITEMSESKDIIYIGREFPDEYKGSGYTKSLKGSRAKAKANAVQGILELIKIATNKRFRENYKEKHAHNAEKGWYYYTVRFALPVYDNDEKTQNYNIYSACLLVNYSANGRKYLYDLVDIKREASTPLPTNE